MADADWPGYVGAVTGAISLVVSGIAYRRSNQIKRLDMRLELRKALGEAHQSLTTLQTLMTSATGSRSAVLAAKGLYRSGNMVIWEQMLATDRAEVEKITASIRSEDADFATLSVEQLESETVAAHKIKTSLTTLVDKYRGELAADDEARRQIADQVTAITAARIQAAKPPG
jgi:hypothetical protein